MQGVALLTLIGGWSCDHKPLRANVDSVDDRPDPPSSCWRRETGEIADNGAHLGLPGELRVRIITEVQKGRKEQIFSPDCSLGTHMAPFL